MAEIELALRAPSIDFFSGGQGRDCLGRVHGVFGALRVQRGKLSSVTAAACKSLRTGTTYALVDPEYREELERRRNALLAKSPDTVFVVFGASEQSRNSDVTYPFRQTSDFLYLTGFDEPDSVLVLRAQAPHYVLFVRPKDKLRETWEGRRLGVEGASEVLGADAAFPLEALKQELPSLLEGHRSVSTSWGAHPENDAAIFESLSLLRRRRVPVRFPTSLLDLRDSLHELRLVKSGWEAKVMRHAASISARAHLDGMKAVRGLSTESELEAVIECSMRTQGAKELAYESIVGSAENGTILHYRENDAPLSPGSLVLVDAGAEWRGYASDITRTFPVSGVFSQAQREVYVVVLQAQNSAIEACRPGTTLDEIHELTCETLVQGLVEIGLIDAASSPEARRERLGDFYMHRTSHWLGLDVHDVGGYHVDGEIRPLEEGHVLTIEPGLYFAEDDDSVPERYRGIGVRIEDDVLVQAEGCEVLTQDVPKSVEEIEAVCSEGRRSSP